MQRFREGDHPYESTRACHASTDRSSACGLSERTSVTYPEPADPKALRSLEEASRRCRACDLWRTGTQTVFGEGPRTADVVFLGEQPGDQEDKAGEPFSDRRVATAHPSSILRAPPETCDAERAAFVKDLRTVAKLLKKD